MEKRELKILKEGFRAIEYDPTPGQWNIHLNAPRLALVAGGERSGKSRLCSADIFVRAWALADQSSSDVLVWLIGQRYEDSRAEFDYMAYDAVKLGFCPNPTDVSRPQVGPCFLRASTVNGGRILVETKSAREPADLASKAPHFIVMCEAAKISYEGYLRSLGRIAEKRGRMLLGGTFEGSLGWYRDSFDEWQMPNQMDGQSFSLPSWSNIRVYPGGENDPEMRRLRIAYAAIPGLFEERCGGVPAPSAGLVFREFRYKGPDANVGRVPFLPKEDVWLAVDPGDLNAYAVLAVQFQGERARVFDCFYESRWGSEEIIRFLQDRPWWKNVRGGAIDGSQPDEKRRWYRYGKVSLTPVRNLKQEIGRRYIHTWLSKPELLTYDQDKCAPLVVEYGKFRFLDKRGDDREQKERTYDEFNHGIKALWYLLRARFPGAVPLPKQEFRPTRMVSPMAGLRSALGL